MTPRDDRAACRHRVTPRAAARASGLGVLLVALTLGLPAPAQAQGTVTMSGSTTAQAVVSDLAFFYGRARRGAPRFSIVGGGTSTGLTDTARGIVDGGMVSRNLGPGDPPGLVLTPFALSGVCLVTNAANPVGGLTRAQVQDLVAARVTNWSQVPGSSRTDALAGVGFEATAGARLVFDSVFLDVGTPFAYAPRTFNTAAQVRDFVERTPAAWAYIDIAYTASLHRVPYEGVGCTRETIRSGAYPAQRPLGVVTRGRPRGALARFLRWVDTSRKARQVIATRYIPY
jgi:phosphate transport system substrate-binding protein